MVALN